MTERVRALQGTNWSRRRRHPTSIPAATTKDEQRKEEIIKGKSITAAATYVKQPLVCSRTSPENMGAGQIMHAPEPAAAPGLLLVRRHVSARVPPP
jgi:hypothetical protein